MTDIAEPALATLRCSNVRRVILVGRRGPLEVSFTIKELREMTKLPGVGTVLRAEDFAVVRDKLAGEQTFIHSFLLRPPKQKYRVRLRK